MNCDLGVDSRSYLATLNQPNFTWWPPWVTFDITYGFKSSVRDNITSCGSNRAIQFTTRAITVSLAHTGSSSSGSPWHRYATTSTGTQATGRKSSWIFARIYRSQRLLQQKHTDRVFISFKSATLTPSFNPPILAPS